MVRLLANVLVFLAYFADAALAADIVVPLERGGRLLFLRPTAPGRSEPLIFVLDTGASHAIIDLALADNLALRKVAGAKVQGVGGVVQASVRQIASIKFTGVELGPMPIAAIDLSSWRRTLGVPIDGLIGYELLSRGPATIDPGAATLTLHDRRTFAAPKDVPRFELTLIDRRPWVAAQLSAGEGILSEGLAMLDTGAQGWLMVDRGFLARQPQFRPGAGKAQIESVGVAGVERMRRGRVESLTLLGRSFPGLPAGFPDDGAAPAGPSEVNREVSNQVKDNAAPNEDSQPRPAPARPPVDPLEAEAEELKKLGLKVRDSVRREPGATKDAPTARPETDATRGPQRLGMVGGGVLRNAALTLDYRGKQAWAAWKPFNRLATAAGQPVDVNAEDFLGRTVLAEAALDGNLAAVETLVKVGAELDRADKAGRTPMHHAAGAGHAEVLDALLAGGASAKSADKEGRTPLHAAAEPGHVAALKSLLKAKADVAAKDQQGASALHLAAQAGRLESVKALLEAGAPPDARDIDDATPLMLACQMGFPQTTLALLDAGADPQAKTADGETPLSLARKAKQADMVKLLLQRGAR